MDFDRNQLERIIKECYWDYQINADDLIEILSGNDVRLKQKVFNKILINSAQRLYDVKMLFGKDLIKKFLDEFVPKYNKKFLVREVKLLKKIILKEKIDIPELAWKKY